jgi:hypothetical protein
VIVSIVLAVVLINNDDDKEDDRDKISLDDILTGKFSARRFNGTWIDGKTFYYFDPAVSLRF